MKKRPFGKTEFMTTSIAFSAIRITEKGISEVLLDALEKGTLKSCKKLWQSVVYWPIYIPRR